MWLIAAVVIVLGGYWWYTQSQMAPATDTVVIEETSQMMAAEPVVVALDTQSGLGQSGTATFADDENGKLVVTLDMMGGEFSQPQPAHIHVGVCPTPGAVKYPLTNVVDGKSVTTLQVSWADLVEAGEPLALNVHKSAAESNVYTACGNLPLESEQTSNPDGDMLMQY